MLPLTTTIYPLLAAKAAEDSRGIVDILRRNSPAFAVDGINAAKTLKSMVETSLGLVEQLSALWQSDTIGTLRIAKVNAPSAVPRRSIESDAHIVRESRCAIGPYRTYFVV